MSHLGQLTLVCQVQESRNCYQEKWSYQKTKSGMDPEENKNGEAKEGDANEGEEKDPAGVVEGE